MKKYRLLPILFLSLFLNACGSSGSTSGNNNGSTSNIDELSCALTDSNPAPTANSWTYWLTDPDIDQIESSAFDLVVMDYSSDGSEDNEFTAEQIQSLKDSGKTVLAYMSIGEAEVDRFYWDASWIDGDGQVTEAAPSWLAESNPDFPDNYKVRYWDADWQSIIFGTDSGADKSYLDRIIDAGFDGVYLDIIDAFEYFGPDGDVPENDTAGEDMITFVRSIANYARNTRGETNFIIVPQNGAAILDNDSACDYLEDVNAIGAEDTFYFGDAENDNELDLDHADEVTPYLDAFIRHEKAVLAIDYVQDADKIDDFYERATNAGYLPYSSVRDLNVLTINAGHEP